MKKATGIVKRFDLHTFRHTFASNRIRRGWGAKKISILLGHSDVSITLNTYSHLLDGDLRVRDEIRLDKEDEPANSEELSGFERMTATISKILKTLGQPSQFDGSTEPGMVRQATLLALESFLKNSTSLSATQQQPTTMKCGRWTGGREAIG